MHISRRNLTLPLFLVLSFFITCVAGSCLSTSPTEVIYFDSGAPPAAETGTAMAIDPSTGNVFVGTNNPAVQSKTLKKNVTKKLEK